MKKERYFRDELHRLFMGYAIIPAVVFTAVCVLILMAALLYGKSSGNTAQLDYLSGELERVVTGYRQELEKLAAYPALPDGALTPQRRAEVFQDFYNAAGSLGYEADIYILDRRGRLLLSNRAEKPGFLAAEPGSSWGLVGSMNRQPGQTVVRLLEPWKDTGAGVALGMAVENRGYLVFVIPSSHFQAALERADVQSIVADRFGWVYASSSASFIDRSNQVVGELEQSGQFLSYDKSLHLVARREVCGGLFRVYAVSDIQSIVVSLTMSGTLIITALALMTVWVRISAGRVTENKTRDFYRILDVMEMAQKGNLESTIQIESDNEFRFIADAYNEMIVSLKRQMENNRKMTELVAVAQNKQLESQFNPHFLYNTLENIRYMCAIEPQIAQKMVYSLSNLLRYSMDGSQEVVTLRQDLEHLENYLTILRYRFNRRFSYQIDVAPQAMECSIPKLVLQPMIENAVKYGFGNQETLRVELKVYRHQGRLVMICRDDGVGMPQQQLTELTQLLEQEENKSRHSGLYNIHRRIRLLYGTPWGVEIRSREGHGATLVVTLPDCKEEL